MKKIFYLAILSYFSFSVTNAQNTITIRLANGKARIPAKEDTFKYKTPVSLIFAESDFKDKMISLYTEKAESKKFIEGKFGDDLGKKTNDQISFFYEIKIEADSTVDLKDDRTIIKTGALFFKIGNGEFVGPINFTAAATNNATNTPKKNAEFKTSYKPGAVLLDAIKLSELKSIMGESDSLQRLFLYILKKYGADDPRNTPNKFIKSALADAYETKIDSRLKAGAQSGGSIFSSAISSVAGVDVTKIADGFAKFIIKRAKQELSIAFFNKLKKELEKYPDLKTLFPNTYYEIQAIDQQFYNYSNFVNSLRESFRSDLQTLDENLPGIIDNHPVFFSKKGNYELGIALRTGCYISYSLKHDVHPGDILDAFSTDSLDNEFVPAEDKEKLLALKGAIQSLQLFSESLKENDTEQHSYWVGIDKIRRVTGDKDVFKTYIGLLLQVAHNKYDDVVFGSNTNLYETLNTDKAVANFDKDYKDYSAYKQYILVFGSKVSEINKMITEYEKPASDSLKAEQYAKYFKTCVQFIQYCVRITNLPYIKDIKILKDLDKKTGKYFDISYETADLATAINRRRYAEAVNHAVAIYSKIVSDPAKESAGNAVAVTGSSRNAGEDTVEKITVSKNASKKSNETTDLVADSSANVLSSLAKYGAFMSNVINAKNSDEVSDAIEAAALPVGSSSIKKNSAFNVSVQSYVGAYGRIGSLSINSDNTWSDKWGVIAPIGVAMSYGLQKYGSISLFGSLFDIGAIVDYRLKKDSVATTSGGDSSVVKKDYKIKLGQIFSPGVYLVYGFPPSIPLSVGIGGQYGPGLGKVETNGNTIINNPQWRWNIFVAVDIPLFNLANSPKRYKP
jgi:hypothetical protein